MSFREHVIAVLVLLLILPLCSCKNNLYSSIDLSDLEPSAGEGIDIDARFLSDTKEIEDLFGFFLPDSGIVPLLVGIRNNDTVPFRIHSLNSLDLRDDFKGFSLVVNGKEIFPIHPAQVIEAVKGLSSPADYRRYGGKDVAAGVVVAPLGAFYAWKGFKEYKEYRPLIKASILPADHGGTFEPLILEPGQEINGYLYFPIMSDEIPYESEEIKETRSNKIKTGYAHRFNGSISSDLFLKARISVAGINGLSDCDEYSRIDSLEFSQLIFCRNDREISERFLVGKCGRSFFGLTDKSGGTVLHFLSDRGFSDEEGQDFFEIKRFRGKSAVLVDAEQLGEYFSCAVNFKRRSRVYIVKQSGSEKKPEVVAVRDYDKKTRRVFLSDDGFTVITDNAFCYFESYSGKKPSYRKISNDFQDAYISQEGKLVVFSGKEVDLLSVSDDNRGKGEKRIYLPKSERDICGSIDDDLVVIFRGRGGRGDTLVSLDSIIFEEKARMPFRGKIGTAVVEKDGILVLMGEGTILDIQLKEDTGFYIRHSGWSDAKFLSVMSESGYLTALTEDGSFVCGAIDLMPPGPGAGGEKRIFTTAVGAVSPSEDTPEEKN